MAEGEGRGIGSKSLGAFGKGEGSVKEVSGFSSAVGSLGVWVWF